MNSYHYKAVRYNFAFLSLVCLLIMAFQVAPVKGQGSCTSVYTLDADFDQGNLVNVNHDSPNNDQLQLNAQTSPPPFIWVACSNRGTVVRIDVTTGAVIGEYMTAPLGRATNPSRTTVDLYGNVWVGNRNENSAVNGVPMGSVIKIGVTIGGTRCNADGTPNPLGDYLKPPFTFNTCVDRDGDGLIKTSRGLGDIKAWNNSGGVDDAGGVSSADDEAILIYARTTATEIRHVSIDANNDVWVGGFPGYNPQIFNKLDGNTGAILATFPGSGNTACGGYGGLVDGNGVLWSASLNQQSILRYDIANNTSVCIPAGSNCLTYGMAVDNNGFIWNSLWACGTINKIDALGNIVGTFATGGNCGRGVAVTSDNDIWVANSCTNDVSRLSNAGGIKAVIPVGNTPTGVAVDANGKVWVTNQGSDNAMRIDPSTNAVDMIVGLGGGAGPYNYSDMTGAVAIGVTSLQGTWNVVKNSGVANTDWGKVSWTELVPTGTAIKIEVRAANTAAGLAAASFVQVTNGVPFCGTSITGQFIEIRATLSRQPFVSATPVLYDLTVEQCDNTNPNIVCPNDITVNNDAGVCFATISDIGNPTAWDNCGVYSVVNDHPSTTYPVGTTVVTWTVTDYNGNTSSCTQNVTVVDNQAPTISVSLSPNVLWPPNHKMVTINASVSVNDNCGSSSTSYVLTSVTSNEADNGLGDGDTPNDIQGVTTGTADVVFSVRAERSGKGTGRIYTATYTATDASGNTQTGTATISVPHSSPRDLDYSIISELNSGLTLSIQPNPVELSAVITYYITEEGYYKLDIYNSMGIVVDSRFKGFLKSGTYQNIWNLTENSGSLLSNGIYFIKLSSENNTVTIPFSIVR